EKGVILEADLAPSLPLVSGDIEQLSRVVRNLVSNALRHTPAAGRIQVSARQGAGTDADVIEFAVADNGEGIPTDYLERIFERFVQVPGTSAGGAGLG